MMYKAKVAVCSDIRTKHSKQSERHAEFLNVKPGGKGKSKAIPLQPWKGPDGSRKLKLPDSKTIGTLNW